VPRRFVWSAIAGVYAQLVQMMPSPVVALNRAVAVAMADGQRHLRRRLATIGPGAAGDRARKSQ